MMMVVQVWTHAKVVVDPAAYDAALESALTMAVTPAWLAVVAVPLAYHAVYGVWLALRPDYNVRSYPLGSNWLYTFQRMTGILVLAFVVLHLVVVWLPLARHDVPEDGVHDWLAGQLSATHFEIPWLGFAYLLGVAACAFHLAVGLWTAAIRWGLTVSRRARRHSGIAVLLLGCLGFALGSSTVVYWATGSRLLAPEEPTSGECGPG
jgi:succinate dehydrogenase / fumarate reductase cytochrome b subunit